MVNYIDKTPLRIILACIVIVIMVLFLFAGSTSEPKQKLLISQTSNLKPEVLKIALVAYECARRRGIDEVQIFSIIDYTIPSSEKRLWVFDLSNNKLLFNTWAAHGVGSGENEAMHFSNMPHSHTSSIGLFSTGNTYQGKHGLSLELNGLEKGFNDHAYKRNIVMHSAEYVSGEFANKYGRLGRSWGCPAIPESMLAPIIGKIKKGTLLFSYYPLKEWLSSSQYINCAY